MDKVLNPSLMSLGPFEEHLIFQMLDINSLPQGTWIKSFLYYNQQRAGTGHQRGIYACPLNIWQGADAQNI